MAKVHWKLAITPIPGVVFYEEAGDDVVLVVDSRLTDIDLMLAALSAVSTHIAKDWRGEDGSTPKSVIYQQGPTPDDKPVILAVQDGNLTYTVNEALGLEEAFKAIGRVVKYVVGLHFTRQRMRAVG